MIKQYRSPLYQLRLHREDLAREVAAIMREEDTFWGSATLKDERCTVQISELPTVKIKLEKQEARDH